MSGQVGVQISGVGRLLVAVYGVLALAATGRSIVQVFTKFDQAPLAYALSVIAAVVYGIATWALIRSGAGAYRIAWVAIGFELVGVITVGTLSLAMPNLFPHDTVWSKFGMGYVFIPAILPIVGMWWLARHRPGVDVS
ncbi:MAG: hypothetical protein B5766_08735 [Candidatus Lumbricidophila eiseniae]|uniref:Integral membrane protein n=1 Tax=Candidatus Lumbricidiphila eiseniae TaxID=1969409 RepID=A0A2A6FR03_9MICO|nr:MAG: hypothetical protein B5766_08735 [Candidatus Lumbricidophila eiseniae]